MNGCHVISQRRLGFKRAVTLRAFMRFLRGMIPDQMGAVKIKDRNETFEGIQLYKIKASC